jgi:hypothetical protein
MKLHHEKLLKDFKKLLQNQSKGLHNQPRLLTKRPFKDEVTLPAPRRIIGNSSGGSDNLKPNYTSAICFGFSWNSNRNKQNVIDYPYCCLKGYRFRIEYEELSPNKTNYIVSPYYTVDDMGSDCVLRFHAGTPYSDIGFRIQKGVWQYNPKKGFKYHYDAQKGLLHLKFNFVWPKQRRN